MEIRVWEGKNFQGSHARICDSDSNLADNRYFCGFGNCHWSDRIDSFQVVKTTTANSRIELINNPGYDYSGGVKDTQRGSYSCDLGTFNNRVSSVKFVH